MRTLHDIPKGAFVCTYVGEILEPELNEERLNGCKYAVDLDYIDLCEQAKQTIRKKKGENEEEANLVMDVGVGDEEIKQVRPHADPYVIKFQLFLFIIDFLIDFLFCSLKYYVPYSDDSDDQPSPDTISQVSSLSEWETSSLSSDEEDEAYGGDKENEKDDQSSLLKPEFLASNQMDTDQSDRQEKREELPTSSQMVTDRSEQKEQKEQKGQREQEKPTEKLPEKSNLRFFFDEKFPYVCDATKCGNVSRFVNYSCSPNLIVQNVFTHTHDPRFSNVAFFAGKHIKAFAELTWDYGIGKNPEKLGFLCKCHSINCWRNDSNNSQSD